MEATDRAPVEDAQPRADDPWAARDVATPWRRRWYVRLLKFVGVAGVLAIGMSVISYPLYVTEPCVIIPRDRMMVRSLYEGVLREVLVDEGAEVKKGQVLARLDDRTLQAEHAKVTSDIARLSAQLDLLHHGPRAQEIEQLRATVTGQEQQVEFAKREVDRSAALVERGVEPPSKLETAKLDLTVKSSRLEESQAALRLLLAGTRPEEIDAAKAELARAKAEAAFIEERLRKTEITSPIDGRVLTPRLRERLLDHIAAGGMLCEVATSETVNAEILVPERELDGIRIGLPTKVKVESYPGAAFTGTVQEIGEVVERKEGGDYVRVTTRLQNRDAMLKQDMNGWAEVDAGRRSLAYLATRRLVRWIHVRFLL
jgi:HlyD family secretion protein